MIYVSKWALTEALDKSKDQLQNLKRNFLENAIKCRGNAFIIDRFV